MSKKDMECKKCHATMELHDNLKLVCPYCGYSELLIDMDKALADKEETRREELRGNRETENLKEIGRQREVELKYEDKKDKRKNAGPFLGFLLVVILLAVFFGMQGVSHFKAEKKEQAHIDAGDLKIPLSSDTISDEKYDYKDLHTVFYKNGFTNIKLDKIEDLKVGVLKKQGVVEKVTVNGEKTFSKGAWVPKDSEVLISYHTKKSKKTNKGIFKFLDGKAYCPYCDAKLDDQDGFDKDKGVWICTECGTVLYGEEVASTMEVYEGVVWFCDSCESCLSTQEGFYDACGTWTCTRCGFNNTISEEAIDE